MKQIEQTLYGKDKSGKLKLWEVYTDDNIVIVRHGKLGGKIQEKYTESFGKNQGKSNETSDSEQAIIEAIAKYVKQCKKGYYPSKEEALDHIEFTPMKAHDYKDFADRVTYPCYLQPKLNGLRSLTNEEKDMLSKAGEPYSYPASWKEDIDKLNYPVDGEVFSGYMKDGGMSLQQINSAWKKHNENTPRLCYYLYDIPVENVIWTERLELLESLFENNTFKYIKFVDGKWCNNEQEADQYYFEQLENGSEGVMYRNEDGLYEYGYRSYSLIKRKPRPDAEAMVVSVKKDKNNWGVLTCQLENGTMFECQMRVDSHETINYRLYENSLTLVGKFIKFEYEEYSDSGVPTKPVGVGLREVDENWQPKD